MNQTIPTCKRLGFIIALSFLCAALFAQTANKFGKVSEEELNMTTFAADTTASAVVLYKKGDAFYDYVGNYFQISYTFEKRIKVLKPEGTEYANVSIPYYSHENPGYRKEIVTAIDAAAYNIENGKIVKTKLTKDYIFRERVSESRMLVKLSIPGVKVGTVIEFKYKLISEFDSDLKEMQMQEEIPVVGAQYDLTIPEYFKFNMDMRGQEKINFAEKSVPLTIPLGGGDVVRANGRNLIFSCSNLPAVKGDSYVWCKDDYISKITFELDGFEIPGSVYKSFTSTWEKIDKLLIESDSFGKQIKMKNPFKEEMILLGLDQLSTNEKIARIFCFIKQRVAWNEKYALFGTDIKKSIKEGSANNAELNFILMSMLRDAGIDSAPVVMSLRSRGILPFAHPSVDKLNTFVVRIQNSDSTAVYLDGSIGHGFINLLPPVLMVNRARVVDGGGNKWVDLSSIGTHQMRSILSFTINDKGELEGERTASYTGLNAVGYRNTFKAAKDSTEYVEKRETENGLHIVSLNQEGVNAFSPEVKEKMVFTKSLDHSGDYLYINPMVFLHIEKSPFVQEKRALPVEFANPYTIRIQNIFTIPEGYEVEELPKPIVMNSDDNTDSFRYLIQQQGNKVNLNYQLIIKRVLYVPDEYNRIKEFWRVVAEKNNEMIVLKKKL